MGSRQRAKRFKIMQKELDDATAAWEVDYSNMATDAHHNRYSGRSRTFSSSAPASSSSSSSLALVVLVFVDLAGGGGLQSSGTRFSANCVANAPSSASCVST